MDRSTRVAAGFFVLALALASWSATARASEPSDLYGGEFRSTSVSYKGEPYAVLGRLRVEFGHSKGHPQVTWHANCNYFGSKAAITDRRVLTGPILSTALSCPGERDHQDRLFARLFRHDPRWRLRGSQLRLKEGDTVVKLRRHDRSN